MTRISRAAMMGLAWAGAWVLAGLLPARLIVGELEPEHIGGPLYAGFICGTVFSELAGMASGRRRLDELSPYRAAAWGALSGLFVGVLPFVLGEGDISNYQAVWATTIVATSATAAGIAAGRRRLGEGSIVPAATLAAVVSGLLFLTTQNSIERFLPLAFIGGLTALSALSACVSLAIARSSKTHDSDAAAPSH
ncbi:MAG TPA: hypothetical protein VES67_20200 [Vicinamibacterales bacterium]|nr:hypothetical protein [Vicinamibacterales bacterium]